jgi:hypothetical protein
MFAEQTLSLFMAVVERFDWTGGCVGLVSPSKKNLNGVLSPAGQVGLMRRM